MALLLFFVVVDLSFVVAWLFKRDKAIPFAPERTGVE